MKEVIKNLPDITYYTVCEFTDTLSPIKVALEVGNNLIFGGKLNFKVFTMELIHDNTYIFRSDNTIIFTMIADHVSGTSKRLKLDGYADCGTNVQPLSISLVPVREMGYNDILVRRFGKVVY